MRALALPLLLLIAACSPSASTENTLSGESAAAPTIPLVVTLASGRTLRFDMELARTAQEQQQGLMDRDMVAENGGMVFPMIPPRTASFWMQDTRVPLDMLFVGTDGKILFLAAERQPFDRTPVSAGVPVSGVVELRGGRAKELGIAEGDRVQWGACALDGKPADMADGLNFCPAG